MKSCNTEIQKKNAEMDYYHKEEFTERPNPRFIWIWIRMIWYYLQIHNYVLTFIAQAFWMIQYSLLLILTISILINTFNTTYARQNISEEIYSMFSNLTPGYLGIKNFSSEHLGEFSISSMSKINTSIRKQIISSIGKSSRTFVPRKNKRFIISAQYR